MTKVPQLQQINDYLKAVPVNVENRFSDFLVMNYGNMNLDHVAWPPAFRAGYFEIILDVTAGCGIKVDEYVLSSVANRLTLVSPHRLQVTMPSHTKQKDRLYSGYGILFSSDFIHANAGNSNFLREFPFFHPLNSPSVYLNNDETVQYIDIINKIQYEQDNYGIFSKDIIKNYLNILFLKAKQHYHHTQHIQSKNRGQQIYQAFDSLVQKHFLEFNTVKAYADKIHVTPKHLSETIKNVSGQSALQLIHKAQLSYAKSQLLQTGKTVSQIANELNFENSDYFSVFFKRLTGKSPLQFRAL